MSGVAQHTFDAGQFLSNAAKYAGQLIVDDAGMGTAFKITSYTLEWRSHGVKKPWGQVLNLE